MAEVNDKNLTGEGLAALWELIKAEDKAVADIANSKVNVVTGTYTGNGAASRTISLGFKPRVVILLGNIFGHAFTNQNYLHPPVFITSERSPVKYSISSVGYSPLASLADSGFTVHYYDENGTGKGYVYCNVSGRVYYYIAIA